jgi:hypothetical protein
MSGRSKYVSTYLLGYPKTLVTGRIFCAVCGVNGITLLPSIDHFQYYKSIRAAIYDRVPEQKPPTNITFMPVYSHKCQYGIGLLECTRRYTET